jgi:hypothetical protein
MLIQRSPRYREEVSCHEGRQLFVASAKTHKLRCRPCDRQHAEGNESVAADQQDHRS